LRMAQSTCRGSALVKCHVGIRDVDEQLGLPLVGP
jgi:hypothetical protein